MPPIDAKALRSALGRFTTGVTIATCRDSAGLRVGLTANSFNALSLDPPLVLWSLRRASPAVSAFESASHFAINVLTEGQVGLSRRFASPVPDRFAEGQWADGVGGAPVLAGCAAVFECALHQHETLGDHVLFVGRVERLHEAVLPPLVFQGGHYHLLGEML
ncbi:MAG: flavin reductase family protein [Burkholderiales bacterium]|jgi:3-hydroxy-9,10-secoandrosta-1,3,5(10)-triene-9,17-dione monooxygenase reductase component|nr:flavin reductase family protein [Burkholderiales bacterium]